MVRRYAGLPRLQRAAKTGAGSAGFLLSHDRRGRMPRPGRRRLVAGRKQLSRADWQLRSELSLFGGIRPVFPGRGDAAHAIGQGDQDRPAAFAADIELNDALLVLAETQTDDFLVEHFGQLIDGDFMGTQELGRGPLCANWPSAGSPAVAAIGSPKRATAMTKALKISSYFSFSLGRCVPLAVLTGLCLFSVQILLFIIGIIAPRAFSKNTES